jgi:hypothetical protein
MTTEVLGSTANAQEVWIPDDGTFGARLALIRQKMGWGNVNKAGAECGIPPESWRTWERDNVEPRGYEAICKRISARTGVHLDWLMRGRTPPGGQPVITPKPKAAERPSMRRPADNRPKNRQPDDGPRQRTARVNRPTKA